METSMKKGLLANAVTPKFCMVGGAGFECAIGTQARIGIALPASGGPRSRLKFIKPFTSLTGLQEFLSLPGCLVIGKFLRAEHDQVTQ